MSRGLDNHLPPFQGPTPISQDATLTTSFGPDPSTYVSEAHDVEFELQAGSLDDEVSHEITITRRLAFVDCLTDDESSRWVEKRPERTGLV